MNTTSVVTWHQTGLQMYELAGNSKFTATLTSFDVNGWTWNFTDVDPSDADNWIGFAISANDAITLTDADGDETWPDGSTGLIATGTGFM